MMLFAVVRVNEYRLTIGEVVAIKVYVHNLNGRQAKISPRRLDCGSVVDLGRYSDKEYTHRCHQGVDVDVSFIAFLSAPCLHPTYIHMCV